MKKKMTVIILVVLSTRAQAQLIAPPPNPVRMVGNATMLIQFGGHRLEILPTQRAVRQANGQFTVVDANAVDTINKDSLGMAYSYSANTKVTINGEISMKLKTNYTVSSLGNLAAGAKPLVPPYIYVFQAATPMDLVKIVNQLQANSAVEWVEAMNYPVKFN